MKPLTATMLAEEKRTEGRSVLATGLEKLRSTINPGRSSQLGEQEADKKKVRHGAVIMWKYCRTEIEFIENFHCYLKMQTFTSKVNYTSGN